MILCISHSKDFYTIDLVISRLKELGKDVYRLNSDEFSHELEFSYSVHAPEVSVIINDQGTRFSARDIEAVYYRKLWGIKLPVDLENSFRAIYLQEYTTMRNLFFDAIRHVPWMNPMAADHEICENKLTQLKHAIDAGLEVPESLFTNDPAKVKNFFYSVCNGHMIGKLHGSLSRSMAGNEPFFPTTTINENDLDQLDTLLYCPMIFQRKIEKAYELRVIYIDGTFYSGKIDARTSQKGSTDWRIATDISLGWEAYELPADICRKITVMMKNLGLYFGAIDIIREENGPYVFLEVNPQGEWGMLQRDLGYRIGETIAEKLVARIPKHAVLNHS